MENEKILVMKHISKSFPGVKALSDVGLEVRKGEVHALMGENGAGKSTLLKILAGAYTKDEGEIYIEGKEVKNLTPKLAENLGISIIYQEFSSLPDLSIAENIFLGRQYTKKGGNDRLEKVQGRKQGAAKAGGSGDRPFDESLQIESRRTADGGDCEGSV